MYLVAARMRLLLIRQPAQVHLPLLLKVLLNAFVPFGYLEESFNPVVAGYYGSSESTTPVKRSRFEATRSSFSSVVTFPFLLSDRSHAGRCFSDNSGSGAYGRMLIVINVRRSSPVTALFLNILI